jgi:hypothetical protein
LGEVKPTPAAPSVKPFLVMTRSVALTVAAAPQAAGRLTVAAAAVNVSSR